MSSADAIQCSVPEVLLGNNALKNFVKEKFMKMENNSIVTEKYQYSAVTVTDGSLLQKYIHSDMLQNTSA